MSDRIEIDLKFYSTEEYNVLKAALDLPAEPDQYNFPLPHGAFASPVSNAKATLGRVLFYDTRLSRNNTVSCASCHKQELAFSDDKAKSLGFEGAHTKRNSLPLAASANFVTSYNSGNSFTGNSLRLGFLWDERAKSIRELSALAIADPVEMGMNMSELPSKLSQEGYYRVLFSKAYGHDQITADRITDALQEFLNSFFSVNSKFDEGLKLHFSPTFNFSNFTPLENMGKSLFLSHCAGCHSQDMTRPVMSVANNGLDVVYADQGLGGISNRASEMGLFKVPFLRNVALTAPYMHDGRFASLEEVVEHYDSGVQMHPNLHPFLRRPGYSNQPKKLNLTEQEKAALIAFLHTLTDPSFVQQKRFSDPFRR